MYKNRPRGLHIVIINPTNAMVEISQVFDTFTSSDEFHEFIGQKFQPGFIVVAASIDDCVNNLSKLAR